MNPKLSQFLQGLPTALQNIQVPQTTLSPASQTPAASVLGALQGAGNSFEASKTAMENKQINDLMLHLKTSPAVQSYFQKLGAGNTDITPGEESAAAVAGFQRPPALTSKEEGAVAKAGKTTVSADTGAEIAGRKEMTTAQLQAEMDKARIEAETQRGRTAVEAKHYAATDKLLAQERETQATAGAEAAIDKYGTSDPAVRDALRKHYYDLFGVGPKLTGEKKSENEALIAQAVPIGQMEAEARAYASGARQPLMIKETQSRLIEKYGGWDKVPGKIKDALAMIGTGGTASGQMANAGNENMKTAFDTLGAEFNNEPGLWDRITGGVKSMFESPGPTNATQAPTAPAPRVAPMPAGTAPVAPSGNPEIDALKQKAAGQGNKLSPQDAARLRQLMGQANGQ